MRNTYSSGELQPRDQLSKNGNAKFKLSLDSYFTVQLYFTVTRTASYRSAMRFHQTRKYEKAIGSLLLAFRWILLGDFLFVDVGSLVSLFASIRIRKFLGPSWVLLGAFWVSPEGVLSASWGILLLGASGLELWVLSR